MRKEKNNIVHIRPVVSLDDVRENGMQKKHKKSIVVILIIICVLMVGLGVYSQVNTFTNVRVTNTYSEISVVNSGCVPFLSGFLKYGKDGVEYIDYSGQSIWNQSYQIVSPIVATSNASAAVADSGGNQVVIVDKNGIKGEFETYLPIEKIAVSDNGIVAVLMNDGTSPQVICYDSVGNILVEHKSTVTGTGYPTGLALSNNGKTLLVTYLQVSENGIIGNYKYYSFNDSEKVTGDVILSGSKEGEVLPEVKFLEDDISVIIGGQSMSIFSGTSNTKLVNEVVLGGEIDSVFYGESKIGVILRNTVSDMKELRVYNTDGEVIISEEITGEYDSADIVNNQVILYENATCIIYSMFGVQKFSGEMGANLMGVFPVWGVNKYVIIGDKGMQEVRLTR